MTTSRVVRLPWSVAGVVAALVHTPLFFLELEATPPPLPDELTIDLQTFLPPPEEEPPPEPPPPPPREKPRPEQPPEQPVVDAPVEAPTPDPVPPAEPVPDEPAPTTTEPVKGEPPPDAPAEPPPPPPPPPRSPFDPRAYNKLAFDLVNRQKRYPRKARVLGLEGRVIVKLYLDREGRLVGDPKIHRSSGHDVLDEEALRMVRAAGPFPRPEGEVTRTPIIVPLVINFSLKDP